MQSRKVLSFWIEDIWSLSGVGGKGVKPVGLSKNTFIIGDYIQ
jgi:hypothetical protein